MRQCIGVGILLLFVLSIFGTSNPVFATEVTPTHQGSMQVKVSSWTGASEHDVSLSLSEAVDWKVMVKLSDGAKLGSYWGVNKDEQDGWLVFTPPSWNRGPSAAFGFIVQGGNVTSMALIVNGQLWDLYPQGAEVPPLPEPGPTPGPSPAPGLINITDPNDTTQIYAAYRVVSDNGDTAVIELTLANRNTQYTWDGYCFDLRDISFETTGQVTSIQYADGGSPEYTVNGSRVVMDLTWRSIFHLNTTVKVLITIKKAGDDPYPHNFTIRYMRGTHIIYPEIGELPASWKPGNFTLSDLIADPQSYYDPTVRPHSNGFIMYHSPSSTQVIIGLADITYPLNLAKSARMWVPNKYFAMGLALAYEWYKVNPNFLMALAAKENWGTAVTKDPSFKGITVTIDGEQWNWPVMISHPDGIFQIESGNFYQITKYFPDIFPEGANHDDYMMVALDPKDTAWITSPITAAVSLSMERELLYAAVDEKYNEFLGKAKDPWAETEIIDYGYNRGVGSVEALKIFSSNWEKAINAPVLWEALNMEGFGGHVPTVINITATMDMETKRIYDANLTWEDIEYFFSVIRQKFFRPGAISGEEWNAMMQDVHRAYDLLSQHWGGDHISYRYDFLTILRVAMKHWPTPHIPRPTGDDWYYHAKNYNP